jgi:hypothetical protein
MNIRSLIAIGAALFTFTTASTASLPAKARIHLAVDPRHKERLLLDRQQLLDELICTSANLVENLPAMRTTMQEMK